MLNIYANSFMTATKSGPRCTRVSDIQKRKWWQPRQAKCIDMERL